ncbi:bifunctional 3-(3-hydroxy-phenyl)propionate/3-hydroxycinnamic acid hydroxylase [Enemella evansiae]|uniref:bifunctional 3-(3-hydroxy-phenyl)propionate/3-hydroxycinnamic acid hydroxylase n=1 Tax=Enemella evansiae TaxID=2016499 RepID=UPI000B95CDB6|nr:bifunctional 3-(3-hydroxy-phenyl)propionate/3-hydroxycinnamic acid hydroxylase [Enemella evansiae]OYO05333.1 monooxygenase [Enemella evansiae]
MTEQHYDADVAVVGYGPTGLTAALTLAGRGARVAAFERGKDIYARARAVTINDWTMRILQDLGVDDRVDRVIEPQRALRWMTYAGQEVMRVEHPPSTLGTRGSRPRFYNIYQPVLEAELRACAEELDGLQVHFGAEVVAVDQDADGVTITARDQVTGEQTMTRARYAIGADGGSSAVRKLIDIPMTGDTNDTLWIVIDCRVKRWWPDRDFLTFWTDSERPVVDIALSAGNHRWEIPLKPGESEQDFPSDAEVWPLLAALGVTAADVSIHQYAFYRHHVRMADSFRRGRVFLAGDAAHLMPPWAGAGMQTGMRDAYDLGWKLAGIVRGELSEDWLDTYEAERRPSAEFYTGIAVALGRVIKQEASEAEIAAMNTVPENLVTPWEPPLNAPPALAAGWLRGEVGDASIVGRYLPQPLVASAIGRIDRLDALLPKGFVLLGNDFDPEMALTPAEKADWDALGASYAAIRPRAAYTRSSTDLVDLEDGLLPWFDRYGVRVIAIRPDKFVAAADTSGLAVPKSDEPTEESIHSGMAAEEGNR